MVGNDRPAVTQWHEVFDTQGYARPQYVASLGQTKELHPIHLHELEQRLHASLRELGITFGSFQTDRANTWFSDLLPHLFLPEEWELITRGFQQRVQASSSFCRTFTAKEKFSGRRLADTSHSWQPQFQRSAVGLKTDHRTLSAFKWALVFTGIQMGDLP